MRSSSACAGSAAVTGQTWKPRQPRFTAHSTCARSAATSAFEVVPFGVDTTVVVTHGSAAVGATRFWKNEDRKSTRLNSSHVKSSYAVVSLQYNNLELGEEI